MYIYNIKYKIYIYINKTIKNGMDLMILIQYSNGSLYEIREN